MFTPSAPYSVKDVARYIVQTSIENGNPVSNLKLQKMLYYAWVGFYKESGHRYLFKDSLYAWKYGPVVPEVYEEYKRYAGKPILRTVPPGDMDHETMMFLNRFINENKDATASQLVNLTHRDGYPWSSVYKEGERYTKIPFETIIGIECR